MTNVKKIKPFEEPIYVTRPFMPPLEEFCKGLEEIWKNKWLTNNGPVLQRYTKKMRDFLDLENITMFNKGMLALQSGLLRIGYCMRDDKIIDEKYHHQNTSQNMSTNAQFYE